MTAQILQLKFDCSNFATQILLYDSGDAKTTNAFIIHPTSIRPPKILSIRGLKQVLKIIFLGLFFLYVFLTPPALPEVPEARFNMRQTYSLSSLTFNRVTRGSANFLAI